MPCRSYGLKETTASSQTSKQANVINLSDNAENFIGLWCARQPSFKDYSPSSIASNFEAMLN